ncbi:unnamed protein product [Symbiodinium natans]|uniref:Uncharacterized protein n=1 Tax=Symbiodinium natans TaxID=878477 RepID=A0A812REK5_9DINO|nr:unnamed protein product [Symbiodinium natans]
MAFWTLRVSASCTNATKGTSVLSDEWQRYELPVSSGGRAIAKLMLELKHRGEPVGPSSSPADPDSPTDQQPFSSSPSAPAAPDVQQALQFGPSPSPSPSLGQPAIGWDGLQLALRRGYDMGVAKADPLESWQWLFMAQNASSYGGVPFAVSIQEIAKKCDMAKF